MLKEKLEQMRKTGEPFCCLGGSPQARAEWLAFEGSLADFIRLFPMRTPENARDRINRILQNGVAEWTGECWECYTCRVAVLGCCMGEYLSVVNRKEL